MFSFFNLTAWYNEELNEVSKKIMEIRKLLNSQKVKKSDEILLVKNSTFPTTFSVDNLKETWQVADVEIIDELQDSENMVKIEHESCHLFIRQSEKKLCPRCRLHSSCETDQLCERCKSVVQQ